MIAYCLNFNILTKKFEISEDFSMKMVLEVDKPTLGVRIDNFQFQNKLT